MSLLKHTMKNKPSTAFKRASQVSLVLLGTLALTGCDRTNTYQYRNQQDCEKDWGEQDCDRNGEYRSGGFFFFGSARRYQADKAQHAQRVKRGGFGSRFSSGRS